MLVRRDDPVRAARHFNWLVTSIPLNQVMLRGDADQFTAADDELR
jgi:hypothetical protein